MAIFSSSQTSPIANFRRIITPPFNQSSSPRASHSWTVLLYIFDKLLAVPTARVARKLAPLAFGTGLSLLGALPPNPRPFSNAVSSPHSLLCSPSPYTVLHSPILSPNFTQSYPLTHFYTVSSPHSFLRSLTSLSFTQSHPHSLIPSLNFMHSHSLTQFYTVLFPHLVLLSLILTYCTFYAVSFPHSFYTVSSSHPFLHSLIPELSFMQSHFLTHFYTVSSSYSLLRSLTLSPIFTQSHPLTQFYTVLPPYSYLHNLNPLLSFTQSYPLTQFYTVSFPHPFLLNLIPLPIF